MSKRKSGAEHANQANKRVKAPSEADEMLKRALEMQDDFEDGSDSESEGSDEEEGSSQESVSEEEDEEAVEEDEETPAVPIAESSKSAQDRVCSLTHSILQCKANLCDTASFHSKKEQAFASFAAYSCSQLPPRNSAPCQIFDRSYSFRSTCISR